VSPPGLDATLARAVFGTVILIVAIAVSSYVSWRARWAAAGPLTLFAATPVVPAMAISAGVSTDDVLPAVGLVLCALVVDWRRLGHIGWPRLVVVGAAVMAAAGVVASIANASSAPGGTMLLKSVGHLAFLGAIGSVVALTEPVERRRGYVAHAVAMVATAEAAFGLLAWVLPLPGRAGLEATRQMTALLGQVPGRIAGTIGLSPNFLGALFVLSLPLTAAVALRTADPRRRAAWWGAAAAQLLALALTFTRTSLVIAIGVLAILLLWRGHARILLAAAALVLIVAVTTPLGIRLLGDANDRAALWSSATLMMVDHPLTGVGPGQMVIAASADPGRYQATQFGLATNNAHNTILLAGAETGVVGALGSALVNIGLAAAALTILLARRRPAAQRLSGKSPEGDLELAAALGTLGFLVQGMTNNLFAVGVTSVYLVYVFGAFLMPAPQIPMLSPRSPLAGPRRASRSSRSSPSEP
jgi:O-antigen ligase